MKQQQIGASGLAGQVSGGLSGDGAVPSEIGSEIVDSEQGFGTDSDDQVWTAALLVGT